MVVAALAMGAAADPSDICDASAARAASETGVPLPVLAAITRTETGRRRNGEMRPWPWTVNMEGEGRWFETRDTALDFATQRHGRGARSFDVGCFQLNYRWHGEHFDSIEAMFEPLANARYAARFLSDLYREFGNWSAAAGAYHSRTPQHARRYRASFDAHHRAFLAEGIAPSSAPSAPPTLLADATSPTPVLRTNAFPLLRRGAAPSGLGSLVPLGG